MKAHLLPSGTDLIKRLNNQFRAADQTFLLMARVSASGFEQLKKALIDVKRKRKQITIILGVDMIGSSSLEAIRSLFRLHDGSSFNLLCYSGSNFFHPKLFAFRTGRQWVFLVGSSNLTEEGLAENIELNVLLSDVSQSDHFVGAFESSFQSLLEDSREFSSKQIDTLSERARKLASKFREWTKSTRNISATIKKRQSVEVANWNNLVEQMNAFKGSPAYKGRLKEIPNFIRACRKTIGMATNPRVDADRWNDKNVGYFSSLDNRNYKKTLITSRRKADKLKRTFKFLLDERIPLEKRLRETVPNNGRQHVPGMGITLISEILSKYYPTEYVLVGNPIIEALRHYGMRYISSDPVERYLAVLSIYKRLRDESKYPKRYAYLLLDRFMWEKGHRILYRW
jgi:HKD family nuclease